MINPLIYPKRFVEYLFFRIYKHGGKVSLSEEYRKNGSYFYFLCIMSLLPSIIYVNDILFFLKKYIGINIVIKQGDPYSILNKLKFGIAVVPFMLLNWLVFPKRYIASLSFTPRERFWYRNVFLVLFWPPVLWLLYGIVMSFKNLNN